MAKKKPKIYIKPSKRGSFTKYASRKGMVDDEGKITGEAIEEGLNSKNPTIRKKANFARNARKWSKGRKKKK